MIMNPLKSAAVFVGASVLFFAEVGGFSARGEDSSVSTGQALTFAQGEGTDMPYSTEGLEKVGEMEGMTPFYISHLGRHGSRFPVSEKELFRVLNFLLFEEQKSNLTDKGRELFNECKNLEQNFLNAWGMLSPVGAAEQEGIAQRMVVNYPGLFVPTARITAISAFEPRCGQSMVTFVQALKQKKPGIAPMISQGWQYNRLLRFYDEAPAYTKYKKDGPWKADYDVYMKEVVHPDRLISLLFKNKPARSDGELRMFVLALFETAALLPASGTEVRLDKYFTAEEWKELWMARNLYEYLKKSSTPVGQMLPVDVAWPLLNEFLITAERIVPNSTQPALSLRFSHAEAVIPFAALMQIDKASAVISELDQVSKHWKDYEIAPMSANIQWVFYRDAEGKVWVKFLLNERPVKVGMPTDKFPLYSWEKVNAHYTKVVDEARRKAVIEGPPVFD